MMENIISESAQETQALAEKILTELEKRNCRVLLLQGNLGGGKTTFCQGILNFLGAEGPFTSPTFVIMKKYSLKNTLNFENVYHIDCYRIDEKDLLDLGWKEIIADEKNLVLVEWPERIEKKWPENYCKIEFQVIGETTRKLEITTK